MTTQKAPSRAPIMLAMAAILALPMALTAGIGIYRAEREAAAARSAPATPPADVPARQAHGER